MTDLNKNPLRILKKLLEKIAAIQFERDEFNDKNDLWYVHYKKLFFNHAVKKRDFTMLNFDCHCILEASKNRLDFECYHNQLLLDAANTLYLRTIYYEMFINIIFFYLGSFPHPRF